MTYSFTSLLSHSIISVAHAVEFDKLGSGNAGVAKMWEMIRAQFALNGKTPAEAVEFFTLRITVFAFSIIGALAVGLIMYAGIRMIIGGEEGLSESKKIIQTTLIGLVLALVAGVAIAFIVSILHSLLS